MFCCSLSPLDSSAYPKNAIIPILRESWRKINKNVVLMLTSFLVDRASYDHHSWELKEAPCFFCCLFDFFPPPPLLIHISLLHFFLSVRRQQNKRVPLWIFFLEHHRPFPIPVLFRRICLGTDALRSMLEKNGCRKKWVFNSLKILAYCFPFWRATESRGRYGWSPGPGSKKKAKA